ncbi:hypothetical protein PGIGA_G00019120 [Pangasianodon gigas]|uniref:Uncharacterized protein n=1 Tax=Pangasianodon gigas TaxID=30993 RepID=A0ACC5WUP6_PANGG|nr:hypothetical protein [Pangasianodon gigas]
MHASYFSLTVSFSCSFSAVIPENNGRYKPRSNPSGNSLTSFLLSDICANDMHVYI